MSTSKLVISMACEYDPQNHQARCCPLTGQWALLTGFATHYGLALDC
jgi:hypothetical protein